MYSVRALILRKFLRPSYVHSSVLPVSLPLATTNEHSYYHHYAQNLIMLFSNYILYQTFIFLLNLILA
jgi:hypothetical protein